jgi:hypothetical protein
MLGREEQIVSGNENVRTRRTNSFWERECKNENKKFFSKKDSENGENSPLYNTNGEVCKSSSQRWSNSLAVTSWYDPDFPCSSSLVLHKNATSSHGWSEVQHLVMKKLKVLSKTVFKPIRFWNVTICLRAQEKMLTSIKEFLCAAQSTNLTL